MTLQIQPLFLEIAVLVLGILILLFEAFSNEPDKKTFAWCGISGLLLIFAVSFFSAGTPVGADSGIWRFYRLDPSALFFKQIILLTTIGILIMSIEFEKTLTRFIHGEGNQSGLTEFYALPVLTCAGLMWLVSAVDLVMIFVSLEVVSIGFYILVAFMRKDPRSLEAGTKYLILSALSTGFLVYGITWLFGITGRTNLDAIHKVFLSGTVNETTALFALLLLIVALGFKIAAFPFQIWIPDVYQGAPTPITAFLSIASKSAGFVVLLRILDVYTALPVVHAKAITLFTVLAGFTLIYGNLAALPQNNLKRLLAYSSIAHAGYLLIGIACVSGFAIAFYLGAYLLMTLLSFIILAIVSNATGSDEISDFRGLSKRSPFLAFGMLISMLSLAGLPFTAGFFGKFFIFAAAMEQQQYWLVILGAIAVACGFYYYLKVVRAMYWQPAGTAETIPVAGITKVTIIILVAAILFFGVYPEPILAVLR